MPTPDDAPVRQNLLDRDAILTPDSVVPGWCRLAYATFSRRVMADDYPCTFGTLAERDGTLRYAYAEGPEDVSLPATVSAFCALSASHPEARHALVIFIKPRDDSPDHEDLRDDFWRTLVHLHRNDPTPWPESQPTDPQDPLWEFCFGGLPAFVFGAAPTYVRRRARNLGDGLVLLLQPRSVFRGIEGGTPGGEAARRSIRRRLQAYDGVAPHTEFGSYGDPSTHEWKQYFIGDGDEAETGWCPFRFEPGRHIAVDTVEGALDVASLLPPGSSAEVQHDGPGQFRSWHRHAQPERLTVLCGELDFRSVGEEWSCGPATRIDLPAGVVHESTAGPRGAVYLVQVEDMLPGMGA